MASGETKSVRRSLSRACRTSQPSSYRERQRLFHFDPTNRSVGGLNLIPVAVARNIRQATPVAGSFVGASDAFLDMNVEVSVKA